MENLIMIRVEAGVRLIARCTLCPPWAGRMELDVVIGHARAHRDLSCPRYGVGDHDCATHGGGVSAEGGAPAVREGGGVEVYAYGWYEESDAGHASAHDDAVEEWNRARAFDHSPGSADVLGIFCDDPIHCPPL